MECVRAGMLVAIAAFACGAAIVPVTAAHSEPAAADVARPREPRLAPRGRRSLAGAWPIRRVYLIALDALDASPERRNLLKAQLADRLAAELGWVASDVESADAIVTLSVEAAPPIDGEPACRVTGIVAQLGTRARLDQTRVLFTFVESERPGVDAVTKFVDALVASSSLPPSRRNIR